MFYHKHKRVAKFTIFQILKQRFVKGKPGESRRRKATGAKAVRLCQPAAEGVDLELSLRLWAGGFYIISREGMEK
ncbi:hypothetical protein ciss_19990 [Carboxydothermus islandicus]|uniref:Uncharacterized protein n=1 Tax=Carboxydothermus islandicus TaxID=661089 RepID=A0A1L8D4D9_9THEO|nr:hypothetical protein ciss_19990 [Carboxydothermus islandicus]